MRSPSCPCGSGVPRVDCDPGELVPCLGEGCSALFHRHNNCHRFCPRCALDRRRASNRGTEKRARARRRAAREAATIAAWEEAQQVLSAKATEEPGQLEVDITPEGVFSRAGEVIPARMSTSKAPA